MNHARPADLVMPLHVIATDQASATPQGALIMNQAPNLPLFVIK